MIWLCVIYLFIVMLAPHMVLSCSDEQRMRMKKEYLSDPQYNYEAVYRASRACGPLVKWAIAQVGES